CRDVVVHDEHGADDLAPDIVGQSDDCDLAYPGEPADGRLHFARCDRLATRADDFAQPALDGEVALVVHFGQIPRSVPAVVERGVQLFGQIEVARHDGLTTQAELAVDDHGVEARVGSADASE